MRLLLVEDEPDLSAVLQKGLQKSGYAVDIANDGAEALDYYDVYDYDLIILDLNLPVLDGLEVLKTIRQTDQAVKILILSARSKIEQRVQGLDLGANDYLVKPFDFLELEARIRTLLRMSFIQAPSVMHCGDLSMDIAAKTVTLAGNPVQLTKKEYAILEFLFLHQNTVLSGETIIEHIWDSDADLYLNSLKYHIHSLKKKLTPSNYLKNVRGHGYKLSEEA